MATVVGEAAIRLDALTSDLRQSIQRDLDRAMRSVQIRDDPFSRLADRLRDKELQLAGASLQLENAQARVLTTERALTEARQRYGAESEQAARAERQLRAALLDVANAEQRQQRIVQDSLRIQRDHNEELERARRAHLEHAREVLRGAGNVAAFGAAAVTSAAKVSLLGAAFGAAGAGAVSLTTGGIGLIGVLAQTGAAAAVLPSALLGIAGIAGTVKLGLQGMSDALSAAFANDPAKLEEALKGLAPSAQAFVREIAQIRPEFEAMKLGVQQRLFDGLASRIDRLARNYLPLGRRMFESMATSINRAGREVLDFLNSSQGVGRSAELTRNLARATDELSGAARPAVSAFLDISTVGSRFLPDLSRWIRTAAQDFADFIRKAAETGELDKWITQAIDTLRTFGGMLRDFGAGLGNIFEIANAQGGGLLNTLREAAAQFRAFTESGPGQKALHSFFAAVHDIVAATLPLVRELAQQIGTNVAPIIGDLARTLLPALVPIVRAIGEALGDIRPDIDAFARGLADALRDPAVSQGIRDLVKGFGDLLAAIGPHLPAVARALGGIASFLGDIMGWVANLLDAMPDWLADSLVGAAALYVVLRKFGGLKLASTFASMFSGLGGAFGKAERTARTGGARMGTGLAGGIRGALGKANLALLGGFIVDELSSGIYASRLDNPIAKYLGLDADDGLFTGGLKAIAGAGRYIGETLWDGIKDAFTDSGDLDWLDLFGLTEEEWNAALAQQQRSIELRNAQVGVGIMQLRDIVDQGWMDIHQRELGAWMQITDTAGAGIEAARARVGAGIGGMVGDVGSGWSRIVGDTANGWSGINGIVGGGVAQMQGRVGSGIAAVSGIMQGGMGGVVGVVGSGWASIVGSANSGASGMIGAAQRGAGGVAGAFSGGGWYGIGTSIVSGIGAGVDAMAANLAARAAAVARKAEMAARAALGIHSPSRVFMEIGLQVMEGFARGIENNGSRLVNAALRAAREMTQTVVRSVDYGTVSQEVWDRLLAEGWRGRPGDNAERLYAPIPDLVSAFSRGAPNQFGPTIEPGSLLASIRDGAAQGTVAGLRQAKVVLSAQELTSTVTTQQDVNRRRR